MDSIETRQRISYLIQHGGLWEQARDRNERVHRLILAGLAVMLTIEVIELFIDFLR